MKQPIAMKCTQEQFEAIEPKLKNHVNDIKNLDSFKSFEYLTNFFRREENCISNLSKKGLWYNENTHVKYEEWNEKIFLEACGIEVEKTFSITESQIKELIEKCPSSQCKEDYLKELFPEAFESEVKFEVGKWYIEKTDLSNGFRIIFAKEVTESVIKGYGLNGYGEWDEKLSYGFGDFIEATEQEVFEALKNEAVKRGFKEGVFIKGMDDNSELELKGEFSIIPENLKFKYKGVTVCEFTDNNGSNIDIFRGGKWAEIIPTITKEEAEQELGKKIIV